jgi:arsenate reductase (thioredoxin)
MAPRRVLFVCTHNGARSRIAEEFARRAAAERIEPCSASLEPDTIGPLPVFVMREVGIELPTAAPKSVFDRYQDQERFDYVITLCDPSSSEQALLFLADVDALYDETAQRLNWVIPNFRTLSGTEDERKARARQIRDRIQAEVTAFLSNLRPPADRG